MNYKIIFLILLSLAFSSCSANKEIAKQKAQHQAETGDRINKSQKNTESLFKEIEQ